MEESTQSPSVLSSPETFSRGVPTHSFEQFEELVHNVVSLRRDLFQRYLDPRRNIDKECGFPDSLSAEQYWELYMRDAIAARVVECVPRAVWQKQPTVYEDEDGETQTPFEEAWDTLGKTLRGERSYYQDEGGNPVMSVLERADILSGIGQYGVILLGLDDGLDLREPVAGVEEKFSMPAKVTKKKPVPKPKQEGETEGAEGGAEAVPPSKKPKGQYSLNWDAHPPRLGSKWSPTINAYVQPKSPRDYDGVKEYETFPKDETDADEPESDLDGLNGGDGDETPTKTCRKLLYLRPFPEASAQITHYETNPTCPRYGQPTQYLITFNDSRESSWQGIRTVAPQHQRQVHWTRIVHVPSDGRLASDVFGTERLRQVYRHVLSLQKLYHGDGEMYWKGAFPGISFETHPQLGGQVQVDKPGLRSEMEQYQNGLQRFLLSMGMTAKMLSPTVSDPTPHIEVQLTAIAIRIGIPKRILMGSERGELSSEQDAGEWDDQVGAWQVNDRNPRIVIPVVDRLINVGCLPEPCGYSIEWPDISVTGEQQQAQIALTLTQAMVAYLQGNGPSFMAPMDYLTQVWGLDEARAQSIIDNAEVIAEQLALEQEEEMLAQMDLREEQLDRGLVADPNDSDLIPDQVGGGVPPFGGGGPPGAEANGFPPKNGKPAFNVRNSFCPTGEGGGVDPSCSTAESAKAVTGYKDHVGLDAADNKRVLKELKIAIQGVSGEDLISMERAVAHLVSSKAIAIQMTKMKIVVAPLKGLHGKVSSGGLMVSADSLKEGGAGFAAGVLRHELEHWKLTRDGVPSGKQESRVRQTAGLWAGLLYHKLPVDHPDRKGLKRAADEQGMTVNSSERNDPTKIVKNIKWKRKKVLNAFCPTGKGGGIDPTCGEDDDPEYLKVREKAFEARSKAGDLRNKLGRNTPEVDKLYKQYTELMKESERLGKLYQAAEIDKYADLPTLEDVGLTASKNSKDHARELTQSKDTLSISSKKTIKKWTKGTDRGIPEYVKAVHKSEVSGKGPEAAEFNDALDEVPKFTGITYHGTRESFKHKVGESYSLPVSVSSSKDPSTALVYGSLLYKIQGKTGADISHIELAKNKEVVLRKGAKFRVIEISKHKILSGEGDSPHDITVVSVEEISDTSAGKKRKHRGK